VKNGGADDGELTYTGLKTKTSDMKEGKQSVSSVIGDAFDSYAAAFLQEVLQQSLFQITSLGEASKPASWEGTINFVNGTPMRVLAACHTIAFRLIAEGYNVQFKSGQREDKSWFANFFIGEKGGLGVPAKVKEDWDAAVKSAGFGIINEGIKDIN
jgi:hypothetical protein